ncbi:MAG: HTH domain-containing protein [Christiangramia sp.]|uniref:HTH domain-containing protein n=1 Tax=Christiangramia sp. TaxID=1931228 RepID=UPI00324238B5
MKSTQNMPKRSQIKIKPKSDDHIRNTGRVERVLKLIKYMSSFRTVREISSHLDIHRKSVHRYINMLTQLGFEIEFIQAKRYQYRIKNIKSYFNGSNNI